MKKKTTIIIAAVLALGLVGGAIAYASIPGPDGVIHACYKNSNPAQGALITIDSTASCPSGYTSLNWNQTGPQGPAGPAPASVIVTRVAHYDPPATTGDPRTTVEREEVVCPTGAHALNGGVSQTIVSGDVAHWQDLATRYQAVAGAEQGAAVTGEDREYPRSNPPSPPPSSTNFALPRPATGNTAWRIEFTVTFPSAYDGTIPGLVYFPIDVTLFAVCI